MKRFSRKKKKLEEGQVRKPKKKKLPILSQDDPRFRSMVMSGLRQASRWWIPSQACISKARVGRGKYQCPLCKGFFKVKEMKKDHIEPVIPLTGFDGWDGVVKRMFGKEEEYQGICKTCHADKTKEENRIRKRLVKQKDMVQSNEDEPDFSDE